MSTAAYTARWPFKDPDEIFACAFDFALELAEGETISGTPEITVALLAGTDASPGALASGSPVVEAGRVLQRLVGGVAGATYSLTCVATTSDGNKLARAAILPVEIAARWNDYRQILTV